MAEKKQPAKEAKPPEPTERIILAGFEMDPPKVAAMLVDAGFGQTANDPLDSTDKERKAKLTEKALKALSVDGTVVVYVEVGEARNGDKRRAIEACVGEGTLGTFRAPSRKAWKDGVRKRPPANIAPDVETLA